MSVPYVVHSSIVEHEPSDPALGLEKNRGYLFSDWRGRRARTRVVEVPQPNRGSETNRRRHQKPWNLVGRLECRSVDRWAMDFTRYGRV
jgi:hypothetical protein